MEKKDLINNLNKIAEPYETKEMKNIWVLEEFKNKKILTFGTFEFLHEGHIKLLNHCLEIAGSEDNLIIGISSDYWNKKKGKVSMENQDQRYKNLKDKFPGATLIFEDHDFAEETWPLIWDEYGAELIIMGGDHYKNLDYINSIKTKKGSQMKIAFFERTPDISSSLIRENLNSTKDE